MESMYRDTYRLVLPTRRIVQPLQAEELHYRECFQSLMRTAGLEREIADKKHEKGVVILSLTDDAAEKLRDALLQRELEHEIPGDLFQHTKAYKEK